MFNHCPCSSAGNVITNIIQKGICGCRIQMQISTSLSYLRKQTSRCKTRQRRWGCTLNSCKSSYRRPIAYTGGSSYWINTNLLCLPYIGCITTQISQLIRQVYMFENCPGSVKRRMIANIILCSSGSC